MKAQPSEPQSTQRSGCLLSLSVWLQPPGELGLLREHAVATLLLLNALNGNDLSNPR